ncbi:MAG TPA: zinc-dependent peptidase [Syntrophobacteraceae bacterium]|nr:zinc-dependent peptidase [Syntrophobacteraceae bacterium]
MLWLRKRRRNRIRSRPFPAAWVHFLEKNVPYYRLLPEEDKKELQGHVLVFLEEKHFEGCGGLELTDEIRVTVAAQACILLLHREAGYYPRLDSILLYPGAYVARGHEELWPGQLVETDQVRLGESWKAGLLVLSWDHVRRSASSPMESHNIVLHEFAHQLDLEDGLPNGAPLLPDRSSVRTWARVLGEDYRRLRRDVWRGRETLLDQYGATDPAEFFAVVTECFFQKPLEMKAHHPRLYEVLKSFYRQDPAELVERQEALS